MNEKDFNFLKTLIGDAFHVRSLCLKYPYENADDSDLGFRNLIWGNFREKNAYTRQVTHFDNYKITLVKSVLDFYNIYANLALGDNVDFLLIGPFADHPYHEGLVRKQMSEQHFSGEHMQSILSFYSNLPVVDIDSLMSMVAHLLGYLIPNYEKYSYAEENYVDKIHQIQEKQETFFAFSFQNSEELVKVIKELSESLYAADPSTAVSAFKRLLPYILPQNNSVSDFRAKLRIVASTISLILLRTSVHPYYIFRQLNTYIDALPYASSNEKLISQTTNYLHKCCLLVSNYSYPDYSSLIRNTVSYINQNLQEDLSLSSLAKRVNKNPSYLSALFNKEVGCTITEYVNSTRIQASLRLLTTTKYSIAEISDLIGISDFSYYTRIFKKQIGYTPSQYRKMLQQDNQKNNI